MVKIKYNGSKWYGQEPDTIEQLYEVLRLEPLRPDYKTFQSDVPTYPGCTCFSGNFANVTHAFCIITDEEETITTLSSLIEQNRERWPITV